MLLWTCPCAMTPVPTYRWPCEPLPSLDRPGLDPVSSGELVFCSLPACFKPSTVPGARVARSSLSFCVSAAYPQPLVAPQLAQA